MPQKSDEIFLISDGDLQSMPNRSMRAGLFGKNLEDALQTLLLKHPEIIPGKQIYPGSEDPPRFVLLRREMPIGNWSLDHLFVDQHGILTLVETKLFENTEARREVIGQIIEYAANAEVNWSSGKLRNIASDFWHKQDVDFDDHLIDTFEIEDIDEFWRMTENNLKNGNVRLIIAADELRPEVRLMIEFLNREMQNIEVFGLELKCYGDSSTELVLVPHLIGQTETVRTIKPSPTRKVNQNEFLANLPDMLADFFASILDTANQKDIFIYWGTKGFSLRLKLPENMISVFYGYPPGAHGRPNAFIWSEVRYIENIEYRDQMYDRFLAIPKGSKHGEYGVEIALTDESLHSAEKLLDIIWEIADDVTKDPSIILHE